MSNGNGRPLRYVALTAAVTAVVVYLVQWFAPIVAHPWRPDDGPPGSTAIERRLDAHISEPADEAHKGKPADVDLAAQVRENRALALENKRLALENQRLAEENAAAVRRMLAIVERLEEGRPTP